MNRIDIIKAAISLVVGSGVNEIVKGIVKNNTTPDSVVEKATIFAGRVVLTAVLVKIVSAHTDAKIDKIVEQFEKAAELEHVSEPQS